MPPPDELLPHLLAFLRTFGFLLSFPALRQQLGAGPVVALAIALTAAASPLPHSALRELPPAAGLLGSAALELLAGLALGIPFALLASILFSGGRLVDLFRGNMLAEQLAPGHEERASPLEAAAVLGLTAMLFSSGLWSLPLTVLYRSFESGAAEVGAELVSTEGILRLAGFAQFALRESFFLLSPALLVIVAFELAICSLGRALPRVHLAGESPAVRLVLGLLALGFVDWESGAAGDLWRAAARGGR